MSPQTAFCRNASNKSFSHRPCLLCGLQEYLQEKIFFRVVPERYNFISCGPVSKPFLSPPPPTLFSALTIKDFHDQGPLSPIPLVLARPAEYSALKGVNVLYVITKGPFLFREFSWNNRQWLLHFVKTLCEIYLLEKSVTQR